MYLRKQQAGSDSFDNTWPHDGAVIQVDDAQAAILLDIPDGGFSPATAAEAKAPRKRAHKPAHAAPDEE